MKTQTKEMKMNNDLHDIAISLGNHIDRLMVANKNGNTVQGTAEIVDLAKTRDDLCRIISKDIDAANAAARVGCVTEVIDTLMNEATKAKFHNLAAELATILWGDIKDFAPGNAMQADPALVDIMATLRFVSDELVKRNVDIRDLAALTERQAMN